MTGNSDFDGQWSADWRTHEGVAFDRPECRRRHSDLGYDCRYQISLAAQKICAIGGLRTGVRRFRWRAGTERRRAGRRARHAEREGRVSLGARWKRRNSSLRWRDGELERPLASWIFARSCVTDPAPSGQRSSKVSIIGSSGSFKVGLDPDPLVVDPLPPHSGPSRRFSDGDVFLHGRRGRSDANHSRR